MTRFDGPAAEPGAIVISAIPSLTPAEQHAIQELVAAAATSDGHRAVNDAGLLALEPRLSAGPEPAPIHVLARTVDGDLAGYAQAIWEADGPVAALLVETGQRRRGLGSALWQKLVASISAEGRAGVASGRAGTAGPTAKLRIWASGHSAAAQALAASQHLQPIRTLLVMSRPLADYSSHRPAPAGVSIRTLRSDQDSVGDDLAGWLRVNQRAFASHPEQGHLTRADVEQRMREPWFDPAGLFLAVRDSDQQIVGFHWLKREPGSLTGEVYVIGVDPTAGIRGLGGALLDAGLDWLRRSGADTVELYVEADNERALTLYRRSGFGVASADVMYG